MRRAPRGRRRPDCSQKPRSQPRTRRRTRRAAARRRHRRHRRPGLGPDRGVRVTSGVQQGVYTARRWTAPKLELAADHVTKTVAPSVSSALRSTAKQVKPAEPSKGRTALTWSLLGAAILATAGAAFALIRYQFRAATADETVEVGETTDVSGQASRAATPAGPATPAAPTGASGTSGPSGTERVGLPPRRAAGKTGAEQDRGRHEPGRQNRDNH